MQLLLISNQFYCSYSFLKSYGISEKSFENWSCRGIAEKRTIEGYVHILYNSIPAPSRAKLPPLQELLRIYKESQANECVEYYKKQMNAAILSNHGKHYNYIRDKYQLNPAQIAKYATYWAAWERLYYFLSKGAGFGEHGHARAALNALFNNIHTSPVSFSRFIYRIKTRGIENAVIDQRAISAGKSKLIDEAIWQRLWYYLADDRKYSAPHILEYLKIDFPELRMPSVGMVKVKRKELLKNKELYKQRYGAQVTAQQLPYQPLHAPTKTNTLWQIDGWTLPFYVKGATTFERWVLIRVIDTCSRKILGYHIAASENITSIMHTLENAVRNAGCVPKELVMDKHTATQTKQFTRFENDISKRFGTIVTATLNAQGKAYIERDNQYLDRLCKSYPEWLGQGISGKTPVRRSPETMRELVKSKNMLTPDEIVARGHIIVNEFNSNLLKPIGDVSPADKYESTENGGITITPAQLQQLFKPAQEYTVRRGMITIKKGIRRITYTLPADLISAYSNEKVMVYSEDVDEYIYVFQTGKSEKHICTLSPDKPVCNAISERNDEPMKSTGKARAAANADKRKYDNLASNPDSAAFLPAYHINKSAAQEIQRNADMQQLAKVEGLKTDNVNVNSTPVVHVSGETKRKHYTPDIDDDSIVDMKPINIFSKKSNG